MGPSGPQSQQQWIQLRYHHPRFSIGRRVTNPPTIGRVHPHFRCRYNWLELRLSRAEAVTMTTPAQHVHLGISDSFAPPLPASMHIRGFVGSWICQRPCGLIREQRSVRAPPPLCSPVLLLALFSVSKPHPRPLQSNVGIVPRTSTPPR